VKKIGQLRKSGQSAATHTVWMAGTFLERALGLLIRKELPESDVLWIVPCTGIHTCFMRFTIDVLFLNKDNQVLRVASEVVPWRFVFAPRGTHSVIELAAGNAQRSGIVTGDVLRIE
jgi:hypothetical protein